MSIEQNGEDRAKYGASVIENLLKRLKYIKGMSKSNLKLFKLTNQKSLTLSDQFKNSQIDLKRLLNACSFTHLIELIKIYDPLKQLFYEVETIKRNLEEKNK